MQGSRSSESTRLPPMWPGIHSQSSAIRGLSLLLVLYFAPRGFSLGTPGFPLSSKSSISKFQFDLYSKDKGQEQGESYFPYILLNEIQTMFPQLVKRSARVSPADLCTYHAHYVKNHRSTVLRRNKNMAVQGGTVSHSYILVIRKFIDFMSLFRHSVWCSFSVKQFPSAEFGICNI